MKIKMILMAALVGAAAMSVNAGVCCGVSIGSPLPVVVTTPVVCATTVIPAPVTVVQTVPTCRGAYYVWVSGAWHYRPVHVKRGHFHAGHR